jgi:hypothetical protein
MRLKRSVVIGEFFARLKSRFATVITSSSPATSRLSVWGVSE